MAFSKLPIALVTAAEKKNVKVLGFTVS